MDRLSYRLTVDGNVYRDLAISADINESYNSMSTCTISIPNTNGKYDSSPIFIPGSVIEFEGSIDGGKTFQTLFYGVIREVSFSLSASGRQTLEITAQGGYYFSGVYLSPNQIVFRQCDIGHIFVGQKNDMNGEAWNPDANGNYPDGLLYKTGYSYLPGSVWSLYPTVIPYTLPRPEANLDPPDVPDVLSFNAKRTFEVINYFADTYGLMFFFDHKNKTFACYLDSYRTTFPDSNYTVKFAENINTRTYNKTDDDVYDSILMVGSNESIFYIEEDFEDPGRYEAVFNDANIKEVDLVVDGAKLRYDIHKGIDENNHYFTRGDIVITPPSVSLIGKKVSIDGGYASNTANVVSVSHRIREDRWDTSIQLDGERRTIPKMLAEIKEQLEKNEDISVRGQVYIKCRANVNIIPGL